ncbi:MAG: hypothetical protein M9918_24560 [Anaerolineae bacterium]|nr:hypothetical protein [Anaerolineae bacterium]
MTISPYSPASLARLSIGNYLIRPVINAIPTDWTLKIRKTSQPVFSLRPVTYVSHVCQVAAGANFEIADEDESPDELRNYWADKNGMLGCLRGWLIQMQQPVLLPGLWLDR